MMPTNEELTSELVTLRHCMEEVDIQVQDLGNKSTIYRIFAQGTYDDFDEANYVARVMESQALQAAAIAKTLSCNALKLNKVYIQILDGKLEEWKQKQRRAQNGDPEPCDLHMLPHWCEELCDLIHKMLCQVDIVIIFADDIEIKMSMTKLQTLLTLFLKKLMMKRFVLIQQPPQTMVYTNQFSMGVQLLGVTKKIKTSDVRVKLISEEQAVALSTTMLEHQERFNEWFKQDDNQITGNIKHVGWTVNFTNLKMKDFKRGDNAGTDKVTARTMALLVYADITVCETIYKVFTLSLPVVLLSNKSQELDASGHIFWDNAFSIPLDNQLVTYARKIPDGVTWEQLAYVIKNKFRSEVGTELNEASLYYLAEKLRYIHHCPIGNVKVQKSAVFGHNLPGVEFTFWKWLYRAIDVSKRHLGALWRDGLIEGFVSKTVAENQLIRFSEPWTFLIRFSESELGAVSITWNNGRDVASLKPYGCKSLEEKSLPDRIAEMLDLKILYPNKDKHVFDSHLSVRSDQNVRDGYVKPIIVVRLETI